MTSDLATDPSALAAHAGAAICERFGVDGLDAAFVLGSGWSAAADDLGEPIGSCELAELPGFAAPTVLGHGGVLRVARTDAGKVIAVLTGRTHFYEARDVRQVVHGVRAVAAAGASTLVLTNGCGSLNRDWGPGTVVLIFDHINLTGASPLHGPRFVDLTDLYSPRLRALAREIDPTLGEGVYAGLAGPHFETPAEIRMLRGLGADLVGMSTVLEAIAARAEGVEVFALSLVTNLAAGISGAPLDHQEVLDAGASAATRMGELLRELVVRS